MARLRRTVLAGQLHLIVQRGHNGAPPFLDEADRRLYRASLAGALKEAGVALHAYGLFATEVRLLLTPSTAVGLAHLMQAVGRRYVRGFNQRHGRSGTPWEGRFRSTVVEAERYFMACMRFVEGDAAGAAATGNSPDPRTPIESSAAHHLGRRMDPLIVEHAQFWTLGNTPFEREANYARTLGQAASAAQQAAIRDAVLKGWALGSTAFIAAIASVSGQRAEPLRRGRPRRDRARIESGPN